MIEIKDNKIIADGIERDIDKINVINWSKGYLSFSSRIADCVKYENGIENFYQKLKKAGLQGFVLVNNNIINLNNISSLHIEFYQYAGISIHKSTKANAELYNLNLVCGNGKRETIPFRTFKEAEQCYHEVDLALAQLKNEEVVKNLLNS